MSSREYKIIKKSGLFDAFYYLKENADIRQADIDPLKHYVKYGWKERRNPSTLFDTSYYWNKYVGVKNANMNPLYHYICFGFYEGKEPKQNADPYLYWCLLNSRRKGPKTLIRKLRDIQTIHQSGLFDKEFYLNQDKSIREKFTKSRYWRLRTSKNPLLRSVGRWFTSTVVHYVSHGVYNGMNPNSVFSNSYYLNTYLDVRTGNNINPFAHYLRIGQDEHREICKTVVITQPQDFLTNFTEKNAQIGESAIHDYHISVITEAGTDPKELENRLKNIIDQTHVKTEIILLQTEQKSSTVRISQKYRQQFPDRIKIIDCGVSERDPGKIREKIFENITSEFTWILPAGNTVEKNFIAELLKYFANESVMLAFCPTSIGDGKLVMHNPLSRKYEKGFVKSSIDFIQSLEIDELIHNFYQGACIFRNVFSSTCISKQVPDFFNDGEFCNFILDVIHGGAVAFTNNTLHRSMAKKDLVEGDFLYNQDEMTLRQQFLLKLRIYYGVNPFQIKKLYEIIRSQVLLNSSESFEYFIDEFDIQKVISSQPQINIMISIIAFSYGGGEIMPIRLANQMKEMGHSVIVHSYGLSDRDNNVRKMLDPSIPVVVTKDINEMAQLLEKFHIDVVNTHHQGLQSFFANVLKSNEKLHEQIFHVGTSHGMYENFNDDTLFRIYKRMGNGVDHWTYVADKNIVPFKSHGIYDKKNFTKISNGMRVPKTNFIDKKQFGINDDSFTACIASRAIPEKGWLQAIEAVTIARQKTGKDIHLMLIGDGEIYQKLINEKVPDYIHLMGFRNNPCDYYAMSDLCLIPSYYKSESAPLSLIEALLCEKPVIGSNIGDTKKMLSVKKELAGDIFDLDKWKVPVNVLAQKIVKMVTDQSFYEKCKELAIIKAHEFDIANVAQKYLDVYMQGHSPEQSSDVNTILTTIQQENEMLINAKKGEHSIKVSVIVPNYNHEKYLRQRLDSIYDQTYKNIEVILLDDCSSDDSRKILQEYADRFPEITKLIFNKKNSGGVYHQWAKGIKNASSEYCWIAESDDFCEPNFLEKVIPAFQDTKVNLSYCEYVFVNSKGVERPNAFHNYVGTIDSQKWKQSYVNDAVDEVETALAIKNTIPNASGAVFKKPKDLLFLEDERWLSMRICGDWIFYLQIVRDGKVAYTTDTHSYFRFHDSNTSVATYSTPAYYKEHEMVACAITTLYDVSEEAILKNYENIKQFFAHNVRDNSLVFEELFDLQRVFALKGKRGKERVIYFDADIDSSSISLPTVLLNPLFSAGKNLDWSIAKKVQYTGDNTGNLLFSQGIKEQLNYVREIYIVPSELNGLQKEHAMIMPSSNFIDIGGDDFMQLCTDFLEKTTFPFTMAGLGAQSWRYLDTPQKLVEALSPVKKKFLKMASERAVTLGIRGEFTAQCLEEMGIHNYRIIGCPSMYKYLDGVFPELPQPTPQRVLMSITTGSPIETKLLELGMDVKAKWVMQMLKELPEMAFEGKLEDSIALEKRFPGLRISPTELQTYMQENAAIFFRLSDWDIYLRDQKFTFAYGSRFHGNMCALRNGIPALWVVHDSRTKELVNTLKLPWVDHEQLKKVKHVEELLEFCDFSAFYQNYTIFCKRYALFLSENHIDHKFKV